jgi:hypothetical protein
MYKLILYVFGFGIFLHPYALYLAVLEANYETIDTQTGLVTPSGSELLCASKKRSKWAKADQANFEESFKECIEKKIYPKSSDINSFLSKHPHLMLSIPKINSKIQYMHKKKYRCLSDTS